MDPPGRDSAEILLKPTRCLQANLIGNTVVCAGAIAYQGPFTGPYRAALNAQVTPLPPPQPSPAPAHPIPASCPCLNAQWMPNILMMMMIVIMIMITIMIVARSGCRSSRRWG